MRIAIFSDVHGNLPALEAVLQNIERQRPDIVYFAGDLCVFGSRPADCVQRLRDEAVGCIMGNTDSWINNQPLLSNDIKEEKRERSENIDNSAEWTWSQLDETDRAWLRTLPFHMRVSPSVDPKDDVYIVHANPRDFDQPIYPGEALQEQLYGEIVQPDNALEPLLGDIIAGVIAFGHVHIPSIRQWQQLTLANISSVSLPLDGDTRAKYGLLTWENGWTIEQKRVEYDNEQEINALKQLKPPRWQEICRQLQTGRPQGASQVPATNKSAQ